MNHQLSQSDIRKVAIFRALQLGDLLCAIPAVRAIKRRFPKATITLVGLPNQRDIVSRFNHYFSDFIEFPGWPGLPERECDLNAIPAFLSFMQRQHFDLVIQMQGNGYIVNPMCMLWGGRRCAGLRREEDFSPDPNLFPVMSEDEHEVIRFMKIASVLGSDADDVTLEFPILPEEDARAHALLEAMKLKPGSYVCVHGGARDPRRRWNPKNFAQVADALAAKGFKILLTGSVFERDVLEEITRHMQHSPLDLVRLFGQVDLGELAALIGHSRGLISNDTGVSHIASALKIRSVIIFSWYSDPGRWRPMNSKLHHAVLPEEAADVADVVAKTLSHFDSVRAPQIA